MSCVLGRVHALSLLALTAWAVLGSCITDNREVAMMAHAFQLTEQAKHDIVGQGGVGNVSYTTTTLTVTQDDVPGLGTAQTFRLSAIGTGRTQRDSVVDIEVVVGPPRFEYDVEKVGDVPEFVSQTSVPLCVQKLNPLQFSTRSKQQIVQDPDRWGRSLLSLSDEELAGCRSLYNSRGYSFVRDDPALEEIITAVRFEGACLACSERAREASDLGETALTSANYVRFCLVTELCQVVVDEVEDIYEFPAVITECTNLNTRFSSNYLRALTDGEDPRGRLKRAKKRKGYLTDAKAEAGDTTDEINAIIASVTDLNKTRQQTEDDIRGLVKTVGQTDSAIDRKEATDLARYNAIIADMATTVANLDGISGTDLVAAEILREIGQSTIRRLAVSGVRTAYLSARVDAEVLYENTLKNVFAAATRDLPGRRQFIEAVHRVLDQIDLVFRGGIVPFLPSRLSTNASIVANAGRPPLFESEVQTRDNYVDRINMVYDDANNRLHFDVWTVYCNSEFLANQERRPPTNQLLATYIGNKNCDTNNPGAANSSCKCWVERSHQIREWAGFQLPCVLNTACDGYNSFADCFFPDPPISSFGELLPLCDAGPDPSCPEPPVGPGPCIDTGPVLTVYKSTDALNAALADLCANPSVSPPGGLRATNRDFFVFSDVGAMYRHLPWRSESEYAADTLDSGTYCSPLVEPMTRDASRFGANAISLFYDAFRRGVVTRLSRQPAWENRFYGILPEHMYFTRRTFALNADTPYNVDENRNYSVPLAGAPLYAQNDSFLVTSTNVSDCNVATWTNVSPRTVPLWRYTNRRLTSNVTVRFTPREGARAGQTTVQQLINKAVVSTPFAALARPTMTRLGFRDCLRLDTCNFNQNRPGGFGRDARSRYLYDVPDASFSLLSFPELRRHKLDYLMERSPPGTFSTGPDFFFDNPRPTFTPREWAAQERRPRYDARFATDSPHWYLRRLVDDPLDPGHVVCNATDRERSTDGLNDQQCTLLDNFQWVDGAVGPLSSGPRWDFEASAYLQPNEWAMQVQFDFLHDNLTLYEGSLAQLRCPQTDTAEIVFPLRKAEAVAPAQLRVQNDYAEPLDVLVLMVSNGTLRTSLLQWINEQLQINATTPASLLAEKGRTWLRTRSACFAMRLDKLLPSQQSQFRVPRCFVNASSLLASSNESTLLYAMVASRSQLLLSTGAGSTPQYESCKRWGFDLRRVLNRTAAWDDSSEEQHFADVWGSGAVPVNATSGNNLEELDQYPWLYGQVVNEDRTNINYAIGSAIYGNSMRFNAAFLGTLIADAESRFNAQGELLDADLAEFAEQIRAQRRITKKLQIDLLTDIGTANWADNATANGAQDSGGLLEYRRLVDEWEEVNREYEQALTVAVDRLERIGETIAEISANLSKLVDESNANLLAIDGAIETAKVAREAEGRADGFYDDERSARFEYKFTREFHRDSFVSLRTVSQGFLDIIETTGDVFVSIAECVPGASQLLPDGKSLPECAREVIELVTDGFCSIVGACGWIGQVLRFVLLLICTALICYGTYILTTKLVWGALLEPMLQ